MPRQSRIEVEGAISHVMARGNARQKIVRDDLDQRRLIDGLGRTVVRRGWEFLCGSCGFLRFGRGIPVAASRPPSGAGSRGLALPPSHRDVTTRAVRVARPFACRQRAQPDASTRSAAEGIARTVRRSGGNPETGQCAKRRHPFDRPDTQTTLATICQTENQKQSVTSRSLHDEIDRHNTCLRSPKLDRARWAPLP
jgi:hypothetical protein